MGYRDGWHPENSFFIRNGLTKLLSGFVNEQIEFTLLR
jgi:hypothetical protein